MIIITIIIIIIILALNCASQQILHFLCALWTDFSYVSLTLFTYTERDVLCESKEKKKTTKTTTQPLGLVLSSWVALLLKEVLSSFQQQLLAQNLAQKKLLKGSKTTQTQHNNIGTNKQYSPDSFKFESMRGKVFFTVTEQF